MNNINYDFEMNFRKKSDNIKKYHFYLYFAILNN